MKNFKTSKLFIVDDDPLYREICKQYLLNLGFEDITLFDNGQDCINKLTEKPDIIFLDHQMHPIDGLDVLKKIKRFDADIYLVVLSAQEDMQVTINALKYGAFDYIIKGDNEGRKINEVMGKIEKVSELLTQKAPGPISRLFSFLSI